MSQVASSLFPYLRWQYPMNPSGPVNSAAISEKGDRCIAATYQGGYNHKPPPPSAPYCVTCWDGQGTVLWTDTFNAYEGPFATAISGDGSIAAAGGWMKEGQGFARIYNAQTGEKLQTYYFKHRVNDLAFSFDGTVLAMAENDAYLVQSLNGKFPPAPSRFQLAPNSFVESISMPHDGSVFVLGDLAGNVYLVENNGGSVGQSYSWSGGSDIGPAHSVAISAVGNWFVAVGDSTSIYLFNLNSIKNGQYANSLDLKASNRFRWVSMGADGVFIATAANVEDKGLVFGIKNQGGVLSELWPNPTELEQNPNSASTDSMGRYVAVATGYDGYPNNPGGRFCLLDGLTGQQVWEYKTARMAWPFFISANGKGIIGGSDDGIAYYFTPEARAANQT